MDNKGILTDVAKELLKILIGLLFITLIGLALWYWGLIFFLILGTVTGLALLILVIVANVEMW